MDKAQLDSLKTNIIKDIDSARTKEVETIFNALKNALKQFDKDSSLKNLSDFFKNIFKSKREKCKFFVVDIFDSHEKLNDEEKKLLRNELLDISNIYRTLIENIISLIDAL